MYAGQLEILSKVQNNESFCLTSHTGFGKSPCFLSLTRGVPSIVIEPRKFLQSQISTYYSDFCLYGRSGYPCPFAYSASSSPCLLKCKCSETDYHKRCTDAKKDCLTGLDCDIFPVGKNFQKYPCKQCEYLAAQREAVRQLKDGKTVICNFGNFWQLLKHAKTVVVDEADLFFRSISSPIKLKYSEPREHGNDTVKVLMDREVKGLQQAAKDKDAAFRYRATNMLYASQFLQKHSELCFTYQRKNGIYVEIDPRNTNILSKKLFEGKRLVIVSATPGAFDLPAYSASIHQRCGIFFAPVGNLTSKNLKANPYLMTNAAKAITEISNYFEMVYDNKRVIVHTGNIGTHATAIHKCLGEDQCTMHSAGKLVETIDTYLKSDKRYLIVASAEYGLDASWSKLQFVLKFPFPSLDERMQTLKRLMGPEFSSFYAGEGRTRSTQIYGRNVRGFDDFGVTVCLDSKSYDDYIQNRTRYPDWLQKRVDTKVY